MKNSDLYRRARQVMPGGVNSPVRSFQAVGGEPIFMDRAQGARIYDVHGREYIDYVCSWGPMILGHNHPAILKNVQETAARGLSFGAPTEKEVLMAELITDMVPGLEMVRMVNSGTEAVMSAIRLARAFTGRNIIIKFVGCYHGHSDSLLVQAGSGVLTLAQPNSLGVPEEFTKHTILAEYNDLEGVRELFARLPEKIAGVIVEPVAANMGVVPPQNDFLSGLRSLCDQEGALLIFDEVITGFRLAAGGAQEYFQVSADIVTFGKIIGGGMPVGAYGAGKKIMDFVAPLGGMYQAGTLSGNPVAMAAGLAQLNVLKAQPGIYEHLESLSLVLAEGLKEIARELDLPIRLNRVASLISPFFTREEVVDFPSAQTSNTKLYARFFRLMLEQGINLAPAQFEAMFVSAAHTEEDVAKTIKLARKSLNIMKESRDFA